MDSSSAITPWIDVSTDPSGMVADNAMQVTTLLRDLVRCCAITLNGWDPSANTHRHYTLASDGYSDASIAHINDEFVKNNPAFAIQQKQNPGSLRWRDYERDWNIFFPDTVMAHDFLIPQGFHEGTTICLRLPDGRYTGAVSMNWSSSTAATDERMDINERFRPILATVCDQLRTPQLLADALAPDAFALVISGNGLTFRLPHRAPGPHLGESGALRRLLIETIRPRVTQRFLWADDSGLCHKVTTTPCRGDVMLATEECGPWPYGLSFREIQVLHLIASGASNPQVAGLLFISTRTASTHVEHILAKTGCTSRAQLAARAVSEGLLLAEPPMRRNAGRK